ncbi:MAG: twin-arginine translocase subunit TatC [Bacteroidales bacterium]
MLKYLFGLFKSSQNLNADFWSHADELRRRLLISALFVLIFSIIAFFFKDFIFNKILLGQTQDSFITYKALCYLSRFFPDLNLCIHGVNNFQLINTEVGGQFRYHLMLSIVSGIIISVPFILNQLWAFIKPSLHINELIIARKFIFFLSLLFFIGIAFGYFIISPITLNFLLNYELSSFVKNMISISSFVSTITMLTFSMGIVFELPALIFFLTKMGIISPTLLIKGRKFAIIIIFIVAGFITPSTDMFSQMLVGLPIILLYEMGIIISKKTNLRNSNK